MDRENEKTVIDGNAFYELDLDCLERKKKAREEERKRKQQKGQRK